MDSRVALDLPHRPGNPRNSEGAFLTLADGRIVFAYSRYTGESWSDHAPSDLAARFSADGGETWTAQDEILVANEGRCNVMSVSLLRLSDGRIALFYLRKNSLVDCLPYMRVSTDECRTWGAPARCIPAPGYYVVNNDRVVQLRTGRLVVPAAYHRARVDTDEIRGGVHDSRAIALFFLSDDLGATWRESDDWLALPVRSRSGLQEPGVVELADGTLYGWARTDAGAQWQMRSSDGGITWTQPERSRFVAPCSPMSVKRVPTTRQLLAVWNDRTGRGEPTKSSWGRTPLSAALSDDEGAAWSASRHVEDDSDHGYCYTAVHFADDAALLAYCCGGVGGTVLQDLRIRKIPLAWFRGG